MQGLKGYCAPWVEDTLPDGVVHVTDPLKLLPGVQVSKAKSIAEAAGKSFELPPVELILGLKALATSQHEFFFA